MRPDTAAHPRQSSAAQPAQPPQPQLRRAQATANYGTDEPWQTAEPVFLAWDSEKYTRAQAISPAASAHAQPNSAAQPACAAARLSEESRVHKFLAALEEAGYEREDNPAQAVLLRELVDALSSGKLLLMPTDDV